MILSSLLYRKLLCTFFLILLCLPALGRHLVGGDFTYSYLGRTAGGLNQYRISLNLYRDCLPNGQFVSNTPFDKTVTIRIFDGGGQNPFVTQVDIDLRDSVILDISSTDPCVPAPNNLCYTKTSYTTIINLPDNPDGYHLAWARCCRNEAIVNLNNPGNQGLVLSAYIPNTELQNSSPDFENDVPTYICANDFFTFNHSAIDVDGDSLVYRLITPFTAGSQNDPFPLATAPPYVPVSWGTGYGVTNFMDGDPALDVDGRTGLLSVRPKQLGQYVFGIVVEEYRNGTRLSSVRRDIQINVVPCPINFPPNILRPLVGDISGDTLTFIKNQETCFDFVVEDFNGEGIEEDNLTIRMFGDLIEGNYGATYDAGTGLSPQNLSICWSPSCEQEDLADNRIIIEAMDENNCPSPNIVYDTLYVRVVDGEIVTPTLNCLSTNSDGNGVLSWEPLAGPNQDFVAFVLSRDDGNGLETIATITDPSISSYIDDEIDLSSGQTYCYQLQIQKDCFGPVLGSPSNLLCTESENLSDFCRISADPGVQGILLEWSPALLSGFSVYRLYRKGADDAEFEQLVEIQDISLLSYQDSDAPIEKGPVCYRLAVVDQCGTELISDEGCSIFGTISGLDFSVNLDWTAYDGWETGVESYEVWSFLPDSSSVVVASLSANVQGYRDDDVQNSQASYCYRIKAVAPTGVCGIEAWSPEICYDFDPLVYIPTAFSPNGDGRNDRFRIKGAFLPSIVIKIYSRWGRPVFESRSLEQAWDGTSQGSAVPEGVYMFHVQYETPSGQQISRSGSLTLIR